MKAAICLAIAIIVPTVAAFTEDFEAYDTVPYDPDSANYSFIETGDNNVRTWPDRIGGTRSLVVPESSNAYLNVDDVDLCDISFDIEHDGAAVASGTIGVSRIADFPDTGEFISAGVSINSAGVVSFTADGATTAFEPPLTMVVNTTYSVEVFCSPTNEYGAAEAYGFVNGGEYFAELVGLNFTTAWADGTKPMQWFVAKNTDTVDSYNIDNIRFPDTVATFYDNAAILNVDSLIGFDVDVTGSVIIARTSDGANVTTYSAESLSQSGTSYATEDCQGNNDGVLAHSQAVLFFDCDASGNTDVLRVRDSSLLPPDGLFPSGCPDDVCRDDINEDDFLLIEFDSDYGQLGQLNAFPITWLFRESLFDSAHLGFSYTTTDGKVGAGIVNTQDNGVDVFEIDRVIYDVGGDAPEDMCGYHHQDEDVGFDDDVVLAVGSGNPTKAWRVTSQRDSGSDIFEPSLVPVFSGNPTVNSMDSIGCGQNRAVVKSNAGTVYLLNWTNPGKGSVTTLATDAGTLDRSVALSGNGLWAAYIAANGNVNIVGANNGTLFGTYNATHLSGSTIYGMELDYAAQSLWIGASESITKYDLTASVGVDLTTVDDEGRVISDDSTTEEAEEEDFFGISQGFSVLTGGNTTSGGYLAGALLVFGVAVTGFTTRSDGSTILAGIGAAVGIALGWALGFFDAQFMFVIIVLILAIMAFFFWRGGE